MIVTAAQINVRAGMLCDDWGRGVDVVGRLGVGRWWSVGYCLHDGNGPDILS